MVMVIVDDGDCRGAGLVVRQAIFDEARLQRPVDAWVLRRQFQLVHVTSWGFRAIRSFVMNERRDRGATG